MTILPDRASYGSASRGGYTLIEVVVSMLLIGMMSALCLPVFLTGRVSGGKADRRLAAADSIGALSAELKGYVAADPSLGSGPGTGSGGWTVPGDLTGLRAFDPGVHTMDPAVWAAALVPYGGTLSYTVSVRVTPTGPQPDVSFLVDWNEP